MTIRRTVSWRVKFTTLPASGRLTDNGASLSPGQPVSVLDLSSGKVQYLAPTNASGNALASLTFQVQDNGGVANFGADTDPSPKTMTFNVLHVNRGTLRRYGSQFLCSREHS